MTLLVLGCEKDGSTTEPAPPLLGFGGGGQGQLAITGEMLEIEVLWTRASSKAREITYQLTSDDTGIEGLEVLTPSPLRVPAGATEAAIQLRARQDRDPSAGQRGVTIELLPGDWYRLTERDSFTLTYGQPRTVDLEIWAPDTGFPRLYGYSSGSEEPVPTGKGPRAGEHFFLAHVSSTEPNVIGAYNAQEGKSTNALNMHRLYADYDVLSSSADIRIPELLRFVPEEEGASKGKVEVIAQRVTVNRRSASDQQPFTVGISGEGTYNENTGIILLDVYFDESELGIDEPVLRRYSYESPRR
jgi:hypothetical protein